MDLVEAFKNKVSAKQLFSTKDKLVLAISGGLDSVVLGQICHEAGLDFELAHCNFQLRGKESERDEEFVKELAKKWKVGLHLKKFDTKAYAEEKKISIQEAARNLRYEWFDLLIRSREQLAKTFLLTAHHADDNAEWLLMNFSRGTGLEGLKGMPEKRDYIRRPLLSFSKQDLISFATERKLEFVEDSSNADSKYTRNLFRNEIIPLIAKAFPQVKANLEGNIRRFAEINELYQLATSQLLKKLCRQKGEELHIPILQLLKYNNNALIYEIIHKYGFSEKQVEELLKLTRGQSGSYLESENSRIIKHRHWLIITPKKALAEDFVVIDEKESACSFIGGNLKIQKTKLDDKAVPGGMGKEENIVTLNSKDIHYPLLLRKWKAGDYFYPLGMSKKKKLARFFIDQKLSRTEKEKVWVLESDRKIIWVVGMRIDDRFKITDSTRETIRLTFERNKML